MTCETSPTVLDQRAITLKPGDKVVFTDPLKVSIALPFPESTQPLIQPPFDPFREDPTPNGRNLVIATFVEASDLGDNWCWVEIELSPQAASRRCRIEVDGKVLLKLAHAQS